MPRPASSPKPNPSSAPRLPTPADWLDWAQTEYTRAKLALGQVATNAHDEALYLILRTLALPLDSDASILSKKLTAPQLAALEKTFQARIQKRTPAAYITREAFLGEHAFYVDERVIIPRSYFLEIIPQLDALLPPKPKHLVDVCTGSGCLALLLAHQYPNAKVDAIDLSPAALEVAAINVKTHRATRRVTLHQSDVFDSVAPVPYDLILSNPPYEPSAHVDKQTPEFKAEPRMAHDGGADGLIIIRKLLAQARTRLAPHGIVLIEVGALRRAIDREFKTLRPEWLATDDGSNCVCLFRAKNF